MERMERGDNGEKDVDFGWGNNYFCLWNNIYFRCD